MAPVMYRLDILFFSRGRGRGHAVRDLAILGELRKLRPGLRLAFASYGAGAEALAEAGEMVVDLELPEANPIPETLVRAGLLLRRVRARLVISHEEPAALPVAKIFGLPTIFLIHWFSAPQNFFMQALRQADTILFIEREGLFPEPDYLKGRVRYVGPVLRPFHYSPGDRDRVRRELGLQAGDKLILMLPGGSFVSAEAQTPTCDLVLRAFQLVRSPGKRLIWVAGRDRDEVARFASGYQGIHVIDADPQIERLMVASDLAITKGTYNTERELAMLGIPSISLSHGRNAIDDKFAQSIPTNTFLWAAKTDAAGLAECIEAGLERGLAPPDFAALEGAGAASVARYVVEDLDATPARSAGRTVSCVHAGST